MKSLLDKDFRYVHSSSTNVRATFDRVRREREKAAAETQQKVAAINRNKGKTP
jgi:hypothetical protein